MSDRLAQLRSLADGVGDLQHGQPGDEDHCTAADVIRWAVAEIERNGRDHQKNAAESSGASGGSVAERPLSDPEVAVEILRLRVAELEQAIRRLAEQDATLSLLCKRDGSQVVTVTMDATLTDAEREAVARGAELADHAGEHSTTAAALRGLMERMK